MAQPQKAPTPSFTPVRPGLLQRCGGHTCPPQGCSEERKGRFGLQRQPASHAEHSTVPPMVHDVLRSPGQPLDGPTRAYMEPQFGHDFSRVRVHTDARAAESARAVNALAYTVGRDVVFGNGQYAPAAGAGRRLLAHELTHVVQQRDGVGLARRPLEVGPHSDAYEKAAGLMASQAGTRVQRMPLERISLQRQAAPRTGLGRTKPSPACGGPICYSGPTELFAFDFDSDRLISGAEEIALRTFARLLSPGDSVDVNGYASVEGPEEYNVNIACHRANRAKLLIEHEAPGVVRSTNANGETNVFGPELAQNRVVEVVINQAPAPTPPPTPTPAPAPTPDAGPARLPNCGCGGTWNVGRATRALSLAGLMACNCRWYCTPPPGIRSSRPRPSFGCGSPTPAAVGPASRLTRGVIGGAIGRNIEGGKTCLCYRDDCMTRVGVSVGKLS